MTPSLRALALLVAAFAGAAGVSFGGLPAYAGLAPTVVVLVLLLADRVAGAGTRLEVRRRVRSILSVGTENQVTLEVQNLGSRALDLEILDERPEHGAAKPDGPIAVRVQGRRTVSVEYRFTPGRRGRYSFDAVHVRHPSQLGLWRVTRRIALRDEIQIYPNIEALHRFELLAQTNSLAELGVRSTRMRGDGTEFERLREFRQGDEPRRVDWKTTVRLGKLIVREMGQERNQNVLFMIDMGRMMQQTTDGLSHFDYALNTAIILGHIAQKKGDNIGAVLFSDTVKRFVPLARGRGAVDALVRAAYDLEPEPVATNYRRAFRHVMASVRRRSLLLVMTHLVPGEDQGLIRAYTQSLGRQHLPLCLFFKEPSLEAEIERVPATPVEAFHRAAASDLVLERLEGLSRLRHGGVRVLDALPGEYSATAVSQYLDIKARNLL